MSDFLNGGTQSDISAIRTDQRTSSVDRQAKRPQEEIWYVNSSGAASSNIDEVSVQSITVGLGTNITKITVSDSSPGTLAEGEVWMEY